jgi:thymidylate synthase ThyX
LIKRGSIHADAEIRNLAIELYRQLSDIAPNSFQDIKIGHENGHDVLVKEEV